MAGPGQYSLQAPWGPYRFRRQALRPGSVLILRFGLDSGTPRTLEEVGAVMGFSRERARQVERDALATLRSPEIRARLQGFSGAA